MAEFSVGVAMGWPTGWTSATPATPSTPKETSIVHSRPFFLGSILRSGKDLILNNREQSMFLFINRFTQPQNPSRPAIFQLQGLCLNLPHKLNFCCAVISTHTFTGNCFIFYAHTSVCAIYVSNNPLFVIYRNTIDVA